MGCLDLVQTRLYEETPGNSTISQQVNDLLNTLTVISDIQSTFSGEFLASFWNQGHQVGFYAHGYFGHGVVGSHFKIQFGSNDFAQHEQVAILNMPAIFSQVND